MFDDELDGILEHYGVRGMKWGVRKARPTYDAINSKTGDRAPVPYNPKKITVTHNPDGTVSIGSKSKRAMQAHQKDLNEAFRKIMPDAADSVRALEARTLAKTAGINKLSNAELDHLIKRTNLEKKYSELYPKQKTAMDKGREFVVNQLKEEANARARGTTGPVTDKVRRAKQIQTAIKVASGGVIYTPKHRI